MKTSFQNLTFGIGLGFLLGAHCSQAAVATLPAAADTFINSGLPDNNAGAQFWFDAGTDGMGGTRRGLIRFNLATIPAGSTINSAVLQLTMVRVPFSGSVDSSMQLYRMTADWTEGSQGGRSGAIAVAGETTWNSRMVGSADWTEAGAASDAAAVASASTPIGTTAGTVYSWSGTGMASDLQLWLDHPAENFGWLLRSDEEGTSRSVRGFASREDSVNFGKLQVTYTPPPGDTNLPPLSIERTNGNLRVFWPLPATSFVLEETSALVSPPAAIAWSEVGLPYQTNAMQVSVIVPDPVGRRCYRLRRP